jgi:hypothetical protein
LVLLELSIPDAHPPVHACEADHRSDRGKNRIDTNRYHKYHKVETRTTILEIWLLYIVNRLELLSRL